MGEKKELTKPKGGDKKHESGEKKGDSPASAIDTLVLKLDLHCEGCATKIRRFIRHSPGVEDVKSNFESGKLTVKGKVDPLWLRERVETKTKKKVELISWHPKNDAGEKKKQEDSKVEEKKATEPQLNTMMLKIQLHCEGCAHKIKRVIKKIKGVQEVTMELGKDLITVKGKMDMKDLIIYLTDKLKRNIEVVLPNGGGDQKKGDGEKEKSSGGDQKKGNDKKEKNGGDKKEKGGEGEKKDSDNSKSTEQQKTQVVNKMEYYGLNPSTYYAMPVQDYGLAAYDAPYPGYVVEYAHQPQYVPHQPQYVPPPPPPTYLNAPQMFSDENPNGCSVM